MLNSLLELPHSMGFASIGVRVELDSGEDWDGEECLFRISGFLVAIREYKMLEKYFLSYIKK